MSGGLLFFFWSEPDWVPGSASATATATASVSLSLTVDLGAGGGHKHDEYVPATEDFWEVRERYIRSLLEDEKIEIGDDLPRTSLAPPSDDGTAALATLKAQFDYYITERANLIAQLRQQETLRGLQTVGNRVQSLTARLSALIKQRNAPIERAKRIRRQKRQVVRQAAKAMLAGLQKQLSDYEAAQNRLKNRTWEL